MPNYPIYAGGKFVTTSQKLEVINPFSGKKFAETYLAGEAEYEAAVQAALGVREEMKQLPAYRRYEILGAVSTAISDRRGQLAIILAMESGKPLRLAQAEIDRAAQTFRVAAEESKRLPKEYISLDWTPAGEKREGIVKYFPVGAVAGISPFNFPMNLAVHKIAPAIAAGCPILLKPASSTPLSTLELAKMIDLTGLPKGALSVLPMTRTMGNKLVTDERFRLLSFTGSPEVGWEMKKNAGKKKVVLELGGNAGVIVMPSASISSALEKSLAGAFAYSGQICIHAQRFFVHESIFDDFLENMTQAAKSLRYGDPGDPATDVSVMIDEANALRVEAWVNEAIHAGAKLCCGGKREGSFYHPTILTGTKASMKVCAEEIFGPVITVEPVSSMREAITRVNEGVFGLQAGVFTNDIREMDEAFDGLEVGGMILNDVPTFRVDHMPYGGVKDSGLGREGVRYAMMDMLEARVLVK
ncbi:MAG: glyceraldehyde-3-phosphate dehydrogenase (NADP) [Bacteroidetes bacterium]|nr:MAG: glyceraldehyde-3-phosphate dehydrogenase (NADP) [Bacteroidota bacterium]